MAKNLYFIYSINDPFIKLTACHTKNIWYYIYLFHYLSIYLHFLHGIYESEIFQWLCGKKMAKWEAGANHDLCQPVSEVR